MPRKTGLTVVLLRALLGLTFVGLCAGTGCGLRKDATPQPESLPRLQSHPDPSGVQFVDCAGAAGLKYRYVISGPRPLNALQALTGGCAFLDYNNDGSLDVLVVGNPQPRLFRGDGRGHFRDVTAETGFLPKLSSPDGVWMGCAVGDIDGSGFDSVYLSGFHAGCLMRNLGGKRFVDVTAQAGIHQEIWGTSCGFAELSRTGRLDLVVGNYVLFGSDTKRFEQNCVSPNGTVTSCGPTSYYAQHLSLYRNLGHGLFHDGQEPGIENTQGKTLGLTFADYEGSGFPGIFAANDTSGNGLYHNDGRGHLSDVARRAGVQNARQGAYVSGMGTDWADFNEAGRLGLVVANYAEQGKPLYRNEGHGLFTDQEEAAGLTSYSLPYLAFGVKWLDYDNDGWLDLAFANGDVADTIHKAYPSRWYRYPTQVLRNLGSSSPEQSVRFADVSGNMGPDLARPIVGRGLAVGDYDNDGREDLLVVDAEGTPLLLHNQGGHVGHWLGIRLVGTRSNRDGYGAMLTARIGSRTLLRHCHADGSYLSSSDKRVHFGLGAARTVDSLSVRWPSGHVDTLRNVRADRYVTVREGG